VPSDAVFTSGHTLQQPQKGATLSNFVSRPSCPSERRSCSTSRYGVMTFDMESPFSASQRALWRTCTGKRPAISPGVHYLPMSLSCATQRVRPGRLKKKWHAMTRKWHWTRGRLWPRKTSKPLSDHDLDNVRAPRAATKTIEKTRSQCHFVTFPSPLWVAGQPGPRAENRERGQRGARCH
jgi:hypothetical protein